MEKPYDTTFTKLIDRHLNDWAAFLCSQADLPLGPASIEDTNLSSTLNSDKLIRIDHPDEPYLLHLEVQSSGELKMPSRLLRYNINAAHQYELSVYSIVLFLRPSANPSDVTGQYDRSLLGKKYLSFQYTAIRLWTLPFETLLNAGAGLATLAPLTNEAMQDIDRSILRVSEKLQAEASSGMMFKDDVTSLYFLLGLRFDQAAIRQLLRGIVMTLKDSSTFQEVLQMGRDEGLIIGRDEGKAEGIVEGKAEGKVEGKADSLKASIVKLCTKRLGVGTAEVLAKIQDETDLGVLEAMFDRAIDATSWSELMPG
ncbi:MAG: Rpn family recombination-promoting nuclease/putative transposase [Fimbriiglobus sp.]